MSKICLIFTFITILSFIAPMPGIAVPGVLDHVVITPEAAKVVLAESVQFTAKGYDEAKKELANLKFNWSVVKGGGSIDQNGLFTAGLEAGFYENTIQVEATQGNVTKAAHASVTVVKPLDVKVTISELKAVDGYLYTCLVENIGIESCYSFELKYIGDAPVDNSQPSSWGYNSAKAGAISWLVNSNCGYYGNEWCDNFAPGQTRSFYFTIPQQLPQIGWTAKNTETGNVDSGLVKSPFVDTPLSPLDVDVKTSVEETIDGYLYTFLVKNIGKESCYSFSIRYIGDEPIDNSQPSSWGYNSAKAGAISWLVNSNCGYYGNEWCDNFAPGQTRSFYFTIPQKSPQIDWKAKNVGSGNLDFDLLSFVDDTTPPSTPVLTDVIASKNLLFARWTQSMDPESDVAEYQYAIGTTKGGTDIVTWTSVGTNTSVTKEGLNLKDDISYYLSVKSKNWVGLWSGVGEAEFTISGVSLSNKPGVFTATLVLDKGVNIISLPLNTDTPYTASSLAAALNSTIVIQAKDGLFDAYVHAGSFGTDFPIQMGKGYIVNLLEAQTFQITGKPWGELVPAAPSTRNRVFPKNSVSGEPWAFVIAGQIEGEVPESGRLLVTNLRTGTSITAPIPPSGQFTAAYVDMSRKSVVAAGDEIITQIISKGNTLLTEAKRHIISHQDIAQAYLLTSLSTKIEQTRLWQNYPNPFNPETWIPYQLAKHADVTIHIYNTHGQLIRTLWLGQQNAGFYVDGSKAAYWNGRSESGERVASGLYFYQLKAGDFTAIRRMVIVK